MNNKGIRTPRQERQNRNTRYQIPLYEHQSPGAGLVKISILSFLSRSSYPFVVYLELGCFACRHKTALGTNLHSVMVAPLSVSTTRG